MRVALACSLPLLLLAGLWAWAAGRNLDTQVAAAILTLIMGCTNFSATHNRSGTAWTSCVPCRKLPSPESWRKRSFPQATCRPRCYRGRQRATQCVARPSREHERRAGKGLLRRGAGYRPPGAHAQLSTRLVLGPYLDPSHPQRARPVAFGGPTPCLTRATSPTSSPCSSSWPPLHRGDGVEARHPIAPSLPARQPGRCPRRCLGLRYHRWTRCPRAGEGRRRLA